MLDPQQDKIQHIIKFFQQPHEAVNDSDPRAEQYYDYLNQNINVIMNSKEFFELPLEDILLIASKIEFLAVEDMPKAVSTFIKNTIKYHPAEKETIMLLEAIKIKNWSFSFDDLIETLACFTNSDLLSLLARNYICEQGGIEVDVDFELQEREKTIEELQTQVKKLSSKNKRKKNSPHTIEKEITLAIKRGSLDKVKYFIEKKNFDPFFVDMNEQTLLHLACYSSSLPIVEYLVEQCGLYIDATDKSFNTPLFVAIENAQEDIAKYLIQNGADPNAQNIKGNNALHIACICLNVTIVAQLVQRVDIDINAHNKEGLTPMKLMLQRYSGHRHTCRLFKSPILNMLLDHGAV